MVVVSGDPADVGVPEGVRVVSDRELRSGTRAWYHEELAGRRWRISARSFFQSRPDGAEALVALVGDALAGALPTGGHLVELSGGVGLFAGPLGTELGPDGHLTLAARGPISTADARVHHAHPPTTALLNPTT